MIKNTFDTIRRALRHSLSLSHVAHARPNGAGELTARELRDEVLALLG